MNPLNMTTEQLIDEVLRLRQRLATQPEARGVEGVTEAMRSEMHAVVQRAGGYRIGLLDEMYRAALAATPNPVRAEQPEVQGAMPTVCDGKEQEAFEVFAKSMGWKMQQHPLHYLFLDPLANAGRAAWREAIAYCNVTLASAPAAPVGSLLPRETLYAALRELIHRIEVCGASPELTKASSLACDLMDTVGNQFNAPRPDAVYRVTAALAGKEGAK